MNRRTKILQQKRESGSLKKLSYPRRRNRAQTYIKIGFCLLVVLFSIYAAISLIGWSGAQESETKPSVSMDLGLAQSSESLLSEHTNVKTHDTSNNGFSFSVASPREMNKVVPLRDRSRELFSREDSLEYLTHTVQRGESLSSIARKYNRRIYSIVSVNQRLLGKYSTLPAGVKLRIPNHDGVLTRIKFGQTMWDLMKSYQVDYRQILSFNRIDSPGTLQAGQELFIPGATPLNSFQYRPNQVSEGNFIWPVSPNKRQVSSRYGDRMHPVLNREIFHRGIDIAGGRGSAVFASRAGEVVYSDQWGEYGITVVVDHENGFRTLYAHLLRTVVEENQFVEKGQPIAFIGSSGLATGDNLHFEIRRNGQSHNPLDFLPEP